VKQAASRSGREFFNSVFRAAVASDGLFDLSGATAFFMPPPRLVGEIWLSELLSAPADFEHCQRLRLPADHNFHGIKLDNQRAVGCWDDLAVGGAIAGEAQTAGLGPMVEFYQAVIVGDEQAAEISFLDFG
jgi:hypothetical protein